jgi:ocular albinism type 1 protein
MTTTPCALCISSLHIALPQQAWIQFFYTATWFWTLCYALDVKRMFKSQRENMENTIGYHIIAWLIPALLTSVGLFVLYLPKAK